VRVDDGDAISYHALRPGTPVRSSDGVHVGTVRRVLDNAREHIFDGIVVETSDGRRFIDAPEVERIFERAVVLTIPASDVHRLSVDRSTPAERAMKALRRRLGRG